VTNIVLRRCAWCERWLTPPPDASTGEHIVTHTICPDCASNIEFQGGVDLQRYLDSLAAPVVLVDDDVVVKAANIAARTLTGKELDRILEYRGGDVFECAHARTPQGCGHTIHCSGCAIRRSVAVTYATGVPIIRRPARLHPHGHPDAEGAALYVTTILLHGLVMLRIDLAGEGG
jgi:hypothetical protein